MKKLLLPTYLAWAAYISFNLSLIPSDHLILAANVNHYLFGTAMVFTGISALGWLILNLTKAHCKVF